MYENAKENPDKSVLYYQQGQNMYNIALYIKIPTVVVKTYIRALSQFAVYKWRT